MAATDDPGTVAQLRPVALFDGGIEGVAVEMGDGKIVKLPVPKDARRSAGRAGLDISVRPAAAVAAEGLHGAIIEPIGGRAKTSARPGGRGTGRWRLDRVGGEVAGRLAGRYPCDAEQGNRESREVELDGK